MNNFGNNGGQGNNSGNFFSGGGNFPRGSYGRTGLFNNYLLIGLVIVLIVMTAVLLYLVVKALKQVNKLAAIAEVQNRPYISNNNMGNGLNNNAGTQIPAGGGGAS